MVSKICFKNVAVNSPPSHSYVPSQIPTWTLLELSPRSVIFFYLLQRNSYTAGASR